MLKKRDLSIDSEMKNNMLPDLDRSLRIAIDGPAGAGKSTVAREVARRLNVKYLDTGAMYRAVTLKLLQKGIAPSALPQIERILQQTVLEVKNGQKVFLDGVDVSDEIRQPYVNNLVSQVAAIPLVRSMMVKMQQAIAANSSGIVMDGRDIASRVMPNADYKFFLAAALPERARRRRKEQLERGLELSLESVIAEITERDRIDSQRSDSPLVVDPEAIVIDTTAMSFEAVVERILEIVRAGPNIPLQ
jgi:cytidylate kinase